MKNVQRLLVLLLLFICGSVTAQNVVTGKVTNKETGEPLQGVSVLADKASGGAVTKEDGTFSLKYKTGASNLLDLVLPVPLPSIKTTDWMNYQLLD
jgi:hypothetical protein